MKRTGVVGFVVAGLAIAAVLAGVLSGFASSKPDGLNKVAAEQGFDKAAKPHALDDTPVAGYQTPGVAGLLGVVVCFGLGAGLVALVRRGHRPQPNVQATSHRGGGQLPQRRVDAESLVHGLPAHVKLVAAFGFVVAVVATPRQAFWAFGLFAAALVAVAGLARIPLGFLVRRLVIEVPFVAAAVLLPFVADGPRTDVLGLSLSVAGLWGAWNVLAKATLGVATSVLLAATTPIADLLAGLDRLRVPRPFTAIAGFMIRYLDVVADDLRRMRVARLSRAHDPRWIWQARAVAATAGALFIRSYERGERVHLAMLARGYDGTVPLAVSPALPVAWATALALPALASVVTVTAWALT